MNKAELVDAIASDTGMSKQTSKATLELIINSISKAIRKNKRVTLMGLGSFSINKRAERRGRNPQTGEDLLIKSKKVVKFKPSLHLSETVNID